MKQIVKKENETTSKKKKKRGTQKDNQIDWINCRIYYRTLIFVQFLLF